MPIKRYSGATTSRDDAIQRLFKTSFVGRQILKRNAFIPIILQSVGMASFWWKSFQVGRLKFENFRVARHDENKNAITLKMTACFTTIALVSILAAFACLTKYWLSVSKF
jgi:hypothetical protein